jgi:hypothetical protein
MPKTQCDAQNTNLMSKTQMWWLQHKYDAENTNLMPKTQMWCIKHKCDV